MLINRINRFISLSSRWLQLDVRYFLKGGIWLSVPTLVSYPMGLLRGVAFARLATPELYGQFGFVLPIISLCTLLSLPGINTALAETVARGNTGSLITAARARARWGLLATLASTVVAIYYFVVEQQAELAVAIFAAGTLIPLTAAGGTVMQYYNGRKKFNRISHANSGLIIAKTVLLTLLLLFQSRLIWLVTADALLSALFFWALYRTAAREVDTSKQDEEVVPYGRSLTWANAINVLTNNIDSILLGSFFSFADVAVYRVAAQLPESTKSLPRLIPTLVLPKIAEKPDKRVFTGAVQKKLFLMQGVNFAGVVTVALIMPWLIPFFFSDTYAGAVGISQLLMLSMAFAWVDAFLVGVLQARKQTKLIYRSNLLSGVLQLGILCVGVPFFGVWGIVASRLIARWAVAIYRWFATRNL